MLSLITQFPGELAALGAACIWAIASFVYSLLGRQMPPLVLNFVKTGIAVLLVLVTVWMQGSWTGMTWLPFLLLFCSGAIGIGVGDTAFFTSINTIGPRRALLLESLAPPLTALLAAIFLDEQLGLKACLGIALTVGGVAWVVIERTPEIVAQYRPVRGILFGLLAALSQASGAVLSRAALVTTDISPLSSTLCRLLGGMLVLLILLATQRPVWSSFKLLRSSRFLATVIGTSFAGTYLAIWLQQTALKYTQAGIAQSLSATSPLFVIPFAIGMGEYVSLRAILGVLLALSGVWLLFDLG